MIHLETRFDDELSAGVSFLAQFADERINKFFAVIWFHAPHAPVVGGPPYRAVYTEYEEDKQHYYAVVTALDEQVGRLRNRLGELNVERNTMLWFCSDNGPEGNPGPRGRHQGSAGPFRGRKRSLYEGGVRFPGLLVWPAIVQPPRAVDVPCVTSDYFPTVLDVLGVTYKLTYNTVRRRPRFDNRTVPIAGCKMYDVIEDPRENQGTER